MQMQPIFDSNMSHRFLNTAQERSISTKGVTAQRLERRKNESLVKYQIDEKVSIHL